MNKANPLRPPAYWATSAVFADQKRYRYRLRRIWDTSRPSLLWVLMNPSYANGQKGDDTVERCVGVSESADFGGLEIVNLFAFRASNPLKLVDAMTSVGGENIVYLIGSDNDVFLIESAKRASTIVVGWGDVPKAFI